MRQEAIFSAPLNFTNAAQSAANNRIAAAII
jgi:hypothetical protein